jgi:hypothetical protein
LDSWSMLRSTLTRCPTKSLRRNAEWVAIEGRWGADPDGAPDLIRERGRFFHASGQVSTVSQLCLIDFEFSPFAERGVSCNAAPNWPRNQRTYRIARRGVVLVPFAELGNSSKLQDEIRACLRGLLDSQAFISFTPFLWPRPRRSQSWLKPQPNP